MAEVEWRKYKLLRREVERAVEGAVGRVELERYVQVLRERGRRREEEEREDGRRVVALLGKMRARAGKAGVVVVVGRVVVVLLMIMARLISRIYG